MPRMLVIIGILPAVVANSIDTFIKINPVDGSRVNTARSTQLFVFGIERILGKHIFEIGYHQLLVLLLMMVANLNNRTKFIDLLVGSAVDKVQYLVINIAPIFKNLFNSGTRKQSTFGTPMRFARLQVIGVKNIGVLRVQ